MVICDNWILGRYATYYAPKRHHPNFGSLDLSLPVLLQEMNNLKVSVPEM